MVLSLTATRRVSDGTLCVCAWVLMVCCKDCCVMLSGAKYDTMQGLCAHMLLRITDV